MSNKSNLKTFNNNSPEYHNEISVEKNINSRIRSASKFCMKSLGIKVKDITKILPEEKSAIEFCLKENFLEIDNNYFGNRDYIFIDLH